MNDQRTKHSIIFTGGGTTGHVTKNLILIEVLKQKHNNLDIHYLGIKTGKEAQLVTPEIATFHPISSGKLRRYFSLQTVPDFFRFLLGIWQSFWLIKKIKPAFIFSSGGYVALPAVIAAWLNKVPIFTHETDSYPGLANRIMAKMAKTIFLGYESAQDYFTGKNTILSGNPVSPQLFKGNREKLIQDLKLDPSLPILLVMGGSQGAQQINDLITPNLKSLQNWNIIHLTGACHSELDERIFTDKHPHYHPYTYVTEEYADFLNAADLIISRAGGNSLAEIAALGKTAILIPLPLPAAAGDHQRKNAIEMLKKHPTWQLLSGEEVTAENLLNKINDSSLRVPSVALAKDGEGTTRQSGPRIDNNPRISQKNTEKPENIILSHFERFLSR